MLTLLLDSNVYDDLLANDIAKSRLAELSCAGRIRVIATPTIVEELVHNNSPFDGVPDWFPVERVHESVFVVGHARLGMAKLGPGDVYGHHRGDSSQIKDAVIADSAETLADIAVSCDNRFRKRLNDVANRCRVMNFEEFQTWLQCEVGPSRSCT